MKDRIRGGRSMAICDQRLSLLPRRFPLYLYKNALQS